MSAWLVACSAGGGATPAVLAPVRAPIGCERLEYALVQDGVTLGTGTLQSRVQEDGSWALRQAYVSTTNTEHLDETEAVVTEAFAPRSSSRLVANMGNVDQVATEYRTVEGRAVATFTRATTGEAPGKPADLRLREHAFDNESAFWLWRALPLEEGYHARYTSVNAFERSQSTVDLTAVGVVGVTVPAGSFEAWRVLVVSGRATRTAWIEVAPPHRMVQWDNGVAFMQLVTDSSAAAGCSAVGAPVR